MSDDNKENTESDVYSLQELIESEKERDEIASAVLGASDAQNCSYSQGYVYRQALYCCLTCLKANPDNLHGICLACSYECHQNHELCELYTKRDFKCDCGNTKFSLNGNKCKLQPNKDDLNALNKYNHNFSGVYCSCNRPYPDPELSSDEILSNEEMIQCSMCEDWFHLKHLLGSDLFQNSEESDYDEMICHLCMLENQFLWFYQNLIAFKDTKVDVEGLDAEKSNKCVLESLKIKNGDLVKEKYLEKQISCFLLDGWREVLCKCENCMQMYKEKGIEFLLRCNDTIKYYEDCGKKNDKESKIEETKLLNDELSKMNHVSQLEFLHNLNDFKDNLKDFLANFARNGQVVKRENIVEFFEDLNEKNKKKRKLNNVNGYFCK